MKEHILHQICLLANKTVEIDYGWAQKDRNVIFLSYLMEFCSNIHQFHLHFLGEIPHILSRVTFFGLVNMSEGAGPGFIKVIWYLAAQCLL